MSDQHILIVEDEPKIAALLKDYLDSVGGFRSSIVDRGDTALDSFHKDKPDLVLLDLMLPGLDGLDVCRRLRQESGVPIIMLTARVEEADRIVGLELGADDYVTKPFSPRELVARVRATLRRASGEVGPASVLRAGDVELEARRAARLALRVAQHAAPARQRRPWPDPWPCTGACRAQRQMQRDRQTGCDLRTSGS